MSKYQEPYYDESGDTELLYATGALKLTIIDAGDENKYTLSNLGALQLEKGMNYSRIKRLKGGTDITQLGWEEHLEPNPGQLNEDKAMFDFDVARGK